MKIHSISETSLQYFIGHRLIPENIDDLRRAIANALHPLGYEPYYADKTIEGKPLLLKICHKIFTASFCVFELSSPNPNVYLEMGIALGFNRPIIAISRNEARIPSVLQGHTIISYTGYIDLEAKIAELCAQGFPLKQPSELDHCHFCNQTCESMSTPPDENSYLVLNRSKLLW